MWGEIALAPSFDVQAAFEPSTFPTTSSKPWQEALVTVGKKA